MASEQLVVLRNPRYAPEPALALSRSREAICAPLGSLLLVAASAPCGCQRDAGPGPDRRGRLLQRSHRPSRCSWPPSSPRRRSTPPAGINGRPLELVAPGRLRRSRLRRLRRRRSLRLGRVGGRRPSLLRHDARRGAGLQRRHRSGRRHLALVVLARSVQRRRLHLPRLPQRPGARRRARRTGCASGSHLERGAVLYLNDQYGRGIRQTFVAEFTRLGGRARGGRSLSRRPARRRPLPRSPGAERAHPSSSWWPATGARRRRSFARRGSAGSRCRCSAAMASRASRRPVRWPKASISRRPTSRPFPTRANRRFVEAFRRKYPDAGMPNQPAAATYDAIYLLRDVIARAGTERAGGPPRPGRRGLGDAAVRRRHRHRRVRRRRATCPTRTCTSAWCSTARSRWSNGAPTWRRAPSDDAAASGAASSAGWSLLIGAGVRHRAARASTRSARWTSRWTTSSRCCSRAPTWATAWSPRSRRRSARRSSTWSARRTSCGSGCWRRATRPTPSAPLPRLGSLTTADRYIVNKIADNQAQIEVAYAMAHALTDLGRHR